MTHSTPDSSPDVEQTPTPEGAGSPDLPPGAVELPDGTGHRQLSEELDQLLETLDSRDTTLGEVVDRIGERGFGLLLALLALPAALPVPAPGYATPFGLMMIGLGAQMIVGRRQPTLPQRFRRRMIRYSFLAGTVAGASMPLRVAEFLIRPRLPRLARSRAIHSVLGVIIVLMAAFMCLPIPLTNTAPSFVIFLIACGMLEEDGLLQLAGILLAPLAGAIAIAALYFGSKYGLEALEGGTRGLLELIRGA
ncbi:MAG: exopolysaccharide biosynthesis protein [Acidobacteriota bacterium]|nr:exopolysaccharide biosynthesis protein [Acidobacteriota bacterium]